MHQIKRSFRRFNHRPTVSSLVNHTQTFSSGMVRESESRYEAVTDEQVIAEALRIISKRMVRQSVQTPAETRHYMALRFAGLEHEVFSCLFLDARDRLIACEDLFRGTLSQAQIHHREVIKRVLANNAAAVILAHNHPSGDAEPSHADELITRRLRDALALIDVRVLDHLVVAGSEVISFAERGLL